MFPNPILSLIQISLPRTIRIRIRITKETAICLAAGIITHSDRFGLPVGGQCRNRRRVSSGHQERAADAVIVFSLHDEEAGEGNGNCGANNGLCTVPAAPFAVRGQAAFRIRRGVMEKGMLAPWTLSIAEALSGIVMCDARADRSARFHMTLGMPKTAVRGAQLPQGSNCDHIWLRFRPG